MAYKFNDSETPKPSPGPRKGKGRMKDSELRSIMHGLISDAEQMVDGELSPKREEATDYFLGKPFGNEEEGRSQVVITEVRDTAHGTLPSMLRVFFGPERCVEFAPRTEAGVDIAEQASDYVQYLFAEENAGFMRARDVALDGLVRKLGIFKWGYEPGGERAMCDYEVTEDALVALLSRDDVTPVEITKNDDDTVDIEYTVKTPGRIRVWSLPPEEFLYDREATSLDDATMVAHRTEKTKGELIALGISEDEIDEHGGEDGALEFNVERQARSETQALMRNPNAGKANDKIKYVEAYVLVDVDGDGEAELRKVCTIGGGCHVVVNKPAEERPFSIFCPFPEPHTITGQSQADLTMDLQKVQSMLARAVNDSLALSIFPRMTVIEGAASIEDVLNTEIGAPIRTKRENAVMPLSHPFTGEKALPVIDYYNSVGERRTGQDKGSMGLDADALQSSTKQAVNAAVTKSQEQIEMLCRIFAEQALKPMFRGLYRLVVKHQPRERLVKLRGTYVPINPASWEADLDVTVNVALGSLVEQKLATLRETAADQAQVLQMFGPDNPLVTVAQYRETRARMLELSGFRDVSLFYKPVDKDWKPPVNNAPPPPSPEQVIAQAQLQIEKMRTERELAIKEAELQQKREESERDHDLEVRKLATQFTLKRYEIDAHFRAQYTGKQLEIDADHEALAIDKALDIRKQMHEEEHSQHERDLAAQDQEHRQGMERQQAEAEQAAAAQSQEGQSEPTE